MKASRRSAWIMGLLALVLLVTGGALVLLVNSPPPCTELVMWTSDEKEPELTLIADRFRRNGPKVDGKCVSVTMRITGSRASADVLAQSPEIPWAEPAKPDLWSPSSSVWIERLRASLAERAGRVSRVPENLPSLATSPIVIAMPRHMATALGWPEQAIGWRDLLALAEDPRGWGAKGHPEWGAFKIGKTNPFESTTGLLATTATASALAGTRSVLTAADVDRVAEDLRKLEKATVHYGRYVETFVGNLYEADQQGKALDYVSAIAMEEKVLLDYNQGKLLGNPNRVERPREPLAAIFPSDGTMASDSPAMILEASWVPDEKRRAAEEFLRWAQQMRETFQAAGFRDGELNGVASVHTQDNGTLLHPNYFRVRTPGIATMERVREVWQQTRRRANILLVMDVSDSMKTPVEPARDTRLKLAQLAAAVVPDKLASDDQLALWEFSGDVAGQPHPWLELVPLGPVSQVRQSYLSRVAALQFGGETALYATTRAGVEHMAARFDPSRINAVIVLSDGKNQYIPDNNLDRLLEDLKQADKDRVVRVFTIAYGTEADAGSLAQISVATRARSYDAKDATTIEGVMLDVLSNF